MAQSCPLAQSVAHSETLPTAAAAQGGETQLGGAPPTEPGATPIPSLSLFSSAKSPTQVEPGRAEPILRLPAPRHGQGTSRSRWPRALPRQGHSVMFWGTSRQSNTPRPTLPTLGSTVMGTAREGERAAGLASLSLGITAPRDAATMGTLPLCPGAQLVCARQPLRSSHLGRGGGAAGVPRQCQPQCRSELGSVRGGTASGLSHGAGRAAVTPATGSPWGEAGGRGQDGPPQHGSPRLPTLDPADSLGAKGWERLPTPRATPHPAQAAERAFVELPPISLGHGWALPPVLPGKGAPAHALSPGSNRPLRPRGAAIGTPIPTPLQDVPSGQTAAGMKRVCQVSSQMGTKPHPRHSSSHLRWLQGRWDPWSQGEVKAKSSRFLSTRAEQHPDQTIQHLH